MKVVFILDMFIITKNLSAATTMLIRLVLYMYIEWSELFFLRKFRMHIGHFRMQKALFWELV